MKDNDTKLLEFEAFRKTFDDFVVLDKLVINQPLPSLGKPIAVNIDMYLRTQSKNDPRRILMYFENVRDFQFSQTSLSEISFMNICVTTFGEAQHEYRGYEVQNSDNGYIIFKCSNFYMSPL